ncbi:hypothetical protein PIROE2DRAFT_3239 [Piromyces sp. E2]|nr:hypothetical protein PIROE2DRAFT_3239 [Piromyces sp. E2]|eukprot:OUM69000.1 hypothetical protein PIROE2DRAFT_3239 [Piromyces sp. E2]
MKKKTYTEPKTKIFNDKKISKFNNWDKYLGKFNIIRLNMKNYFSNIIFKEGIDYIKEGIDYIKENIIYEVKNSIPNFNFSSTNYLNRIFIEIERETGRKIVLIIEDWDIILKEEQFDEKSKNNYMKFLDSIIIEKNYLALAYLTGVLPISNTKFTTLHIINVLK